MLRAVRRLGECRLGRVGEARTDEVLVAIDESHEDQALGGASGHRWDVRTARDRRAEYGQERREEACGLVHSTAMEKDSATPGQPSEGVTRRLPRGWPLLFFVAFAVVGLSLYREADCDDFCGRLDEALDAVL